MRSRFRNRLVHDYQFHRIPDDDRYFLEESYGRVALEMRQIIHRRGVTTRGSNTTANHNNNHRAIVTEQYDWYAQFDDDDDDDDHDEDDNLHRLALHHHHSDANDFETVIRASKELEHDLRANVLGWEDNYVEAPTRPSLLDMIQLVQRRRLFRSEIINDMFRFLKVRNKLVHDYEYNKLSPRDRSIFVETQQRLAVEMQPYRMQAISRNSRRRQEQEPTESCHFAFFACSQVAPETTASTTTTNASPRRTAVHTRTIQSATTTISGRVSTKVRQLLVAAGLPKHVHHQQVLAPRDFCGRHYMSLLLAVGALVFLIAIRYQATVGMAALWAMVVVTLGRGAVVLVYAPVLCARQHRAWLHVTHQVFGCDICGRTVAKDCFLYGCQTCNWDACQSCAKRLVLAAKHRNHPVKHYYA